MRDLLHQGSTWEPIATAIGYTLALMHDNNVIHGDLTTSNMIIRNKELYFIDFGLSHVCSLVEDKAVDLYVLERSIKSTHPQIASEFVWETNPVSSHTNELWLQKTQSCDIQV